MTNPTDKELDEAVAKAFGADWFAITSFLEDKNVLRILHLDWNALMAAVAVVEKSGEWLIARSALDKQWNVCRFRKDCTPQWSLEHHEKFDNKSEAHALALCIHAVVSQ